VLQGGMRFGRGSSDSRSKGGAGIAILIAIALVVVAWVLSIFIRFALSRKREYLADAGSVELTKNPDGMISALRKIEGRGELAHASSGIMEMCIDNPRVGFSNMFATHPPIDARVAAIVQYMGGHDPGPIALPDLEEPHPQEGETDEEQDRPAPAGPWGSSTEPQPGGPPGSGSGGEKPFLPSRPPIELGGTAPPVLPPGPWGPREQK
jgi:heat shock protein HtpX